MRQRTPNRRELILFLIALGSALVYLAQSYLRGNGGFALDDAWIHQVYARNLGTNGEFAFFTGQPSAGSTSPLWSILLALGYFLQVDFRFWAYLLGILLLGLGALIAKRIAERLIRQEADSVYSYPVPWLVALFLLFEWHLVWGSVSGMEIPLFVLLALVLMDEVLGSARAWLLGLLAGLLTLTRPEGLVLAALAGLPLVVRALNACARDWRASHSLRSLLALLVPLAYGLCFLVLMVPYLVFNYWVSGTVLPNTFYAKNVEYAVLLERTPFLLRWLQLFAVPWVGAQVLLLPGYLYIAAILAKQRQWSALIPWAWTALLPALYALRLPVSYQHGRYEMPVIPFLVLYGMWGTAALLSRIPNRIVRASWTMSTVTLLVVFWYVGADAYATDVAIVDCEMVQTAQWVSANASPNDVVAAHDIGALGYYYKRPVLDLAGLVTPDVIPFMRDEGRLREWLDSRKATFAVFFPDWYPRLAADPGLSPVHSSNCPAALQAGGTDMVIYRVLPPAP